MQGYRCLNEELEVIITKSKTTHAYTISKKEEGVWGLVRVLALSPTVRCSLAFHESLSLLQFEAKKCLTLKLYGTQVSKFMEITTKRCKCFYK